MKVTMKYKLNVVALVMGISCVGLFAQDRQEKLNERLTVNPDVNVNLNTSHTNIVFETWNKNEIGVEAYIEGANLTDENSRRILDSWQLEILGDDQNITITSAAGNLWTGKVTASNITMTKEELQKLSPAIADMLGPIMENIANNPMPSALPENLSNVTLENKKYSKEEEKYIQQWENQIREKFSEEIEQGKQKLANQIQGKTTPISGQMEIRLDTWGAQYGKQMEAWASQLVKDIQNQQKGTANVTVYQYSAQRSNVGNNTSKIIKIKMPKRANLKMNVRHGAVQLPELASNVKASLSHTKLSANVVEGNQTYIKASYSPVYVKQWNNGKLVVNYVKNCRIQNAKNLLVNADSSNIYIQQLDENGAISASFGMITIANLGKSFTTLDLAVQNSDFKLKLPESAFNLSYSGAQSLISLPKTLEINSRKNFGNVFINGYQDTRSTENLITINAKYSEVVLHKN